MCVTFVLSISRKLGYSGRLVTAREIRKHPPPKTGVVNPTRNTSHEDPICQPLAYYSLVPRLSKFSYYCAVDDSELVVEPLLPSILILHHSPR